MVDEALRKLAEKLRALGVPAEAPGLDRALNRLVALVEHNPALVDDPFFQSLLPRLAADLRAGHDATLTRLELLVGLPMVHVEERPLLATFKSWLLGGGHGP